jgi:8-oxo-dGTP diphosphatase
MRFHYLARGFCFVDGQVLLAHQRGAENTFLPGGHIRPGERAEDTLVREIREELGRTAVVKHFVGAVECVYTQDAWENHELNLLFVVAVAGLESGSPPASCESHLEFLWSRPEELQGHNLLPQPLVECLATWARCRAYPCRQSKPTAQIWPGSDVSLRV